MPRSSAAVAAATARHVLDVATSEFAVHGFAEVSLDTVAREASVTRGAVYHHYRSKVGLFHAVTTRLQERVAASVVEAAEGAGPSAADRLRAGCHAFVRAATAEPVARILLVDAPAVLGWSEWRRLDAENSGTHLREALADVGVADDDLDATVASLSGAMNELALWVCEQPAATTALVRAGRVLDRLLAIVR
ncbi:MAG: TetR family transcriptional regulator [Propionibacteriaceae bacterium]|nr:TetR family transcriptional regulator [Propionibacteriaceae bacterium]